MYLSSVLSKHLSFPPKHQFNHFWLPLLLTSLEVLLVPTPIPIHHFDFIQPSLLILMNLANLTLLSYSLHTFSNLILPKFSPLFSNLNSLDSFPLTAMSLPQNAELTTSSGPIAIFPSFQQRDHYCCLQQR